MLSHCTRKLLWFKITKMLIAVSEKHTVSFIIIFGTLSFPTDDTCANSLLTFRRLLNMFCSNSPTLTLSTDISNQRSLKWPRHLGLGLPDLPYFTGDPVFQPPSPGRKPPGRRNLPYLTRPIGLIERLVT